MAKIKTLILTGTEAKVSDLGGQNAAVKNLSTGTIYASICPDITAGADNVVEIPAGGGEVVLDAGGTVYLLGTGKVQCTGTDYATLNFKMPSSSAGGGGGTDITKAYVDAQDNTNLLAAQAYTDTAINAVNNGVMANSGSISALQSDMTAAQTAIAANTTSITATAAETLAAAKSYTDIKASALDTRVTAYENAINTLSGTGDGSVKKAVSDGIAAVVADAPEDFDTLKEISAWIDAHADSAAAMNLQIAANTATVSSLETAKADKSELPTTLPANGGNANTVNGHTVNADVPANAQFTDTTYSVATTSADGLESKEDKAKLDGIAAGANNYVLPKATNAVLGGVKIGDNISVIDDGTISVPLPSALKAVEEPAGKDLNDYIDPGAFYFPSSATPANIPFGMNGFLLVLSDMEELFHVKQIWFRQGTANVNDFNTAIRMYQPSSGWSNWCNLVTEKSGRIGSGQIANSDIGAYATSEGYKTNASETCTHAGGQYAAATQRASFAHGYAAAATGVESMAFGDRTLTSTNNGFVTGVLNKDVANSMFIIGHGNGGHYTSDLPNFTPTDTVSYNDYGRQGATLKNVFRVDAAGSVYGIGAFNTSGADYAEYIKPWWDDNPDNEDRRGYFVTVKDGKLRKAEPNDYIVGITSGNPSVIGNGDEDWLGRWQRDEFNELIYQEVEVDDYEEQEDENGNLTAVKIGSHFEKHTVEVPEYDSSQSYVERKDRPEWSCVGMIGVLPLRDDGTCVAGGFAKCGSGGIATAADTWDCHKTFFVIKRVNDHIISVEMR